MALKTIKIGARSSKLSRAQARWVIERLKNKFPRYRFRFIPINTLGDRKKDWQKDVVGIFVKEIEEALSRGIIDIALHSAKDMPVKLQKGLKLAAIPKRENPKDTLIFLNRQALNTLKSGSLIGTGSPRRGAQLLNMRGDLAIKNLRGNLDTRIKKLRGGGYSAIIAAAAGIKRLGIKNLHLLELSDKQMLPAAGQGALGIEIRESDIFIEKLVKRINHRESFFCVSCEREFLKTIQAGCRTPVGALARIKNKRIILRAAVADIDGRAVLRLKRSGSIKNFLGIGKALAKDALKKGAGKILKINTR